MPTTVRPRLPRFGRVGVMLFSGLLAVAAMTAGAAKVSAANYAYDWCASTAAAWSISNAGAKGCLDRVSGSATQLTLVPGAHDYTRDGYSARTLVRVFQWVNGAWRLSTSPWITTNSLGFGTSVTGQQRTIGKAFGATHVHLEITACTYNAPTATYISCKTFGKTLYWGS